MNDLNDVLRLIARAGAGQKQLVLDHYKSVLLEAQEANDLCRSLETDYAATMERIDAQALLKADKDYDAWLDHIDSQKE